MDANRKFASYTWRNISFEEMITFHAVLLKWSNDDRSLGGYESYFTENLQLNLAQNYSVKLQD